MKYSITTLFLLISFVFTSAQEMTKELQKVVSDFIDCIKNQKKEKLVSKIVFPFSREYPVPSIKNGKEFLERFAEVFDEKLTDMIVKSDPEKDWSAVGWRGIMLLNGDVWLDYDGKLIAVNYQSAAEEKRRMN